MIRARKAVFGFGIVVGIEILVGWWICGRGFFGGGSWWVIYLGWIEGSLIGS